MINGTRQGTIRDSFQEVYCVTMKRAKRWDSFQKRWSGIWPFRKIKRFEAFDGKKVPCPSWWKQGGGAWGCYRSHLCILEDALNRGVESVLFLEDDALPAPGFEEKIGPFMNALPDNWGMLYLGGQHLLVNKNPPKEINPLVFQPYNVNRTHAFALRGNMMRKAYKHLNRFPDWIRGHHIDHHFGRMHQRREDPIYCPAEWLIGQAQGKSNISGRNPPTRFWKGAESIAIVDPVHAPFVAVIGLHSSGSSALAGCLHNLGLHLGNKLTGYYGNNPHKKTCGFEAIKLAEICEASIKFPNTHFSINRQKRWKKLSGFINEKRREAVALKTMAAGKYPTLCRMGNQLLNICGEQLVVIHADRDIDSSIKSLQKRCPKKDPKIIEAHQRWLHAGKQFILERVPGDRQLTVDFDNLVGETENVIDEVINFLDLEADPEARQDAINWVKPDEKHI